MLRLHLLAPVILLLFGFGPAAAQQQSEPLRIVYNSSWPPYSVQSGAGVKGILPDLMDELLTNRLGIPVQHLPFPWKRAQAQVWSGRADAMVTVPTEERAQMGLIGKEPSLFLHIRPIVAAENTVLADEIMRIGPDFSWTGRRFCHDAGSGWHSSYAAAQGIEAFVAKNVEACVRMIAAGRVDGTLQVQAVARSAIHHLGLEQRATVVDTIIESWKFNLILRKDYPGGESLLNRLDNLLRDMRSSGELERLWAAIEMQNIQDR